MNLHAYIEDVAGMLCFNRDIEHSEHYSVTLLIADTCPSFSVDDDEEIFSEGQSTCLNCRYRRWMLKGFYCFKGFPGITQGSDA